MKIPESIVEAQVESLLSVVRDYEMNYCTNHIQQAKVDAKKLIRQSYKDARIRLHRELLESRERMQLSIAAASAKLHTEAKQRQYESNQRFVDEAWTLLTKQLQQRWQTSTHRLQWMGNVLASAVEVLPADEWQIEFPQGLAESEQKEFADKILKKTGKESKFKPSQSLVAGIRIGLNGAIVDGSLQGLLASRLRIEAELLAQYQNSRVDDHDTTKV